MSDKENPISRELVSFAPSNTELMAGFVVGVNGLIPIDEDNLAKGLAVAAQQADFLGRFIDGKTGKITPVANNAISDLEEQGLLIKENGNWVIPSVEHVNQLNSKVRSIFKQMGIEMLTLAGKAANNAWWDLGA